MSEAMSFLIVLLTFETASSLQCFQCPKKKYEMLKPPYPICFTEAGEAVSDFGLPQNCSEIDNNCIVEFTIIDRETKAIGTRRGCTNSPFRGCRKIALDQVVQCICATNLCNYQLRMSAIVQQFDLGSSACSPR